jgi:uncharacterized protein (DUF427 family)
VSLTYGTGPFGEKPAGRFNFEAPRDGVRYLEQSPRWVRAHRAGETVVDSKQARLLHESGSLPRFLFPPEDVRLDLLPEESVRVHGDGLVEVEWGAVDEWLEEEERQLGHARDPYHRIDVRRSSRHVRVTIGGEVVAESRRAKALFETGLPTRWYFPAEDVRTELLSESDTGTVCAYKGVASYWSVGDEDDIVWTYRDPLQDALEVKDHLAFFNERVDLEVDGELQERPHTQWSRD